MYKHERKTHWSDWPRSPFHAGSSIARYTSCFSRRQEAAESSHSPPTPLPVLPAREQLLQTTASSDHQPAVFREIIFRNLEIQRCRPLPHSTGDIVVRTMAGTEPAAEVTGLSYRYAAQMCADAYISWPIQSALHYFPKGGTSSTVSSSTTTYRP